MVTQRQNVAGRLGMGVAATPPIRPFRAGLFGNNNPTPGTVTLDGSCADVPAAHDQSVQAKLLEALRISRAAQTRWPEGPNAIEYTFAGGPKIFGGGYDMSALYTDHQHDGVISSNHGLPRGWDNLLHGARRDTFVAHTHPTLDLDPNFSPVDRKYHQAGIDDIMIDATGRVRCIPGR